MRKEFMTLATLLATGGLLCTAGLFCANNPLTGKQSLFLPQYAIGKTVHNHVYTLPDGATIQELPEVPNGIYMALTESYSDGSTAFYRVLNHVKGAAFKGPHTYFKFIVPSSALDKLPQDGPQAQN
jgi:hypothetical protein